MKTSQQPGDRTKEGTMGTVYGDIGAHTEPVKVPSGNVLPVGNTAY